MQGGICGREGLSEALDGRGCAHWACVRELLCRTAGRLQNGVLILIAAPRPTPQMALTPPCEDIAHPFAQKGNPRCRGVLLSLLDSDLCFSWRPRRNLAQAVLRWFWPRLPRKVGPRCASEPSVLTGVHRPPVSLRQDNVSAVGGGVGPTETQSGAASLLRVADGTSLNFSRPGFYSSFASGHKLGICFWYLGSPEPLTKLDLSRWRAHGQVCDSCGEGDREQTRQLTASLTVSAVSSPPHPPPTPSFLLPGMTPCPALSLGLPLGFSRRSSYLSKCLSVYPSISLPLSPQDPCPHFTSP